MPNGNTTMIKGYTKPSDFVIDIINENKEIEERLLRRLDEMMRIKAYDKKWLAIAETMFEQAFMAMNRAAFKPKRVDLPEDED